MFINFVYIVFFLFRGRFVGCDMFGLLIENEVMLGRLVLSFVLGVVGRRVRWRGFVEWGMNDFGF